MTKYPTLPSEMIAFANECEAVIQEFQNLYTGIGLLTPMDSWLKEVREIISDITSLIGRLRESEDRSEICAELEELFSALEDTLGAQPDGYRIQNAASPKGQISEELAELIHRTCERVREVANSFHSRIQDAHLW